MRKVDKVILLIAGTLVGIGLIMVYSSSAFHAFNSMKGASFFFQKQLIPLGIGVIACIVLAKIDYHIWGKVSYLIIGVAALLLILVLIVGPTVNGVKRWLKLPGLSGFSIQPSEFAKLGLIIFIAELISRKDPKNLKKGFLPIIIAIMSVGLLIGLEPSFGMLFVICASSLILLYIGGANIRHLILFSLLTLTLSFIVITNVPYAKARLSSFNHQLINSSTPQPGTRNSELTTHNYQLNQSLYGIGAGGILGKGLGNGRAKLLFIPFPHTDFIFSIIGEELGFIGCAGVCLLFLFLLVRGIEVGHQAEDKFGFLLANGISFAIFISMAVHIGVTCGILPTTGVPLPFISFGGSNLLSNLAGIGILLNISKK